MNNSENFELNYWGEGFRSLHTLPPTPKRSLKQKLTIVISFISVLSILPITILAITSLNLDNSEKIIAKAQVEPSNTPTQAPTPTPKVKNVIVKGIESNRVEVVNNDSYWKISKRTCGTGKYYLSVKEQNDGKALYKGDFVTVDCSL